MADSCSIFSTKDLCSWTGGRLEGASHVSVFSVVIDSRSCSEGCLFVALSGERADGHNFIEDVFKSGAVGAVVICEWADSHKELIDNILITYNEVFFLIVGDTLKALQQSAAGYLDGVKHPVKIGITGSNGKTTTKEFIASVLAEKYSVVKTKGNLNSEIGLALSVFDIREQHDYAIMEMGINRVGEMDILADILKPEIVVITNIGSAHIGIFKNIETTAFEKRRSVKYFNKNSFLFLNENESFKDFLAEGLSSEVIYFGEDSIRKLYSDFAYVDLGLKGWMLHFGGLDVEVAIPGKHNLVNAISACVLGNKIGLSNLQIKQGLESASFVSGRTEIIEAELTLINDCYNANYESFEKIVTFADSLEWAGRKIYIFGDMKELGSLSIGIHEKAGEFAVESAADLIFFLGADMKLSYETALNKNEALKKKKSIFYFSNYKELEVKVIRLLKEGDLVLLKASNSMRLDRLVEPVMAKFGSIAC